MKLQLFNISLFVTIFFCVLGCKNNTPPKELTLEEKEFISTHEQIAFDDIMFGMSRKDFDKLRKNSVTINDNDLMFIPMFDNQDQLYRLILASKKQRLTEVPRNLFLIYMDLLKALRIKYGKEKSLKTYPSQIAFNVKGFYDCDIWKIGEKEIKLRLVENNAKYQIWCDIKHAELSDTNWNEKKKEDEKKTKEAANKF